MAGIKLGVSHAKAVAALLEMFEFAGDMVAQQGFIKQNGIGVGNGGVVAGAKDKGRWRGGIDMQFAGKIKHLAGTWVAAKQRAAGADMGNAAAQCTNRGQLQLADTSSVFAPGGEGQWNLMRHLRGRSLHF